jgi:hypothetical protein
LEWKTLRNSEGFEGLIRYKVDGVEIKKVAPYDLHERTQYKAGRNQWNSPFFMPKWAARLWLEVTDVKVERLQEISVPDAKAEGVWSVSALADLWDSINGKKYPWKSNPWVWAYTFKKVERID